MFDLPAVQRAIRECGVDGWLLYDFRRDHIKERYAKLFDLGDVGRALGYPLFMKPYDGGGWVGVSKIDDEAQLRALMRRAVRAFERYPQMMRAEIVIEHGVVLGEVRGLEMCRVVDDPFTGEARVEVGLGAHDREAFAMVHGHLPTEDAMRQVITAVLPHRSFEADHHPFNRFGVERLLRWNAMQDPASVGCASLAPAEPPVVRTNVKDAVPCVAIGIDADGNTVAVTFVNGIDLDAVPFALDAADRLGASRAVLAMRSRDITRSTNLLVSTARTPLSLVAIQS